MTDGGTEPLRTDLIAVADAVADAEADAFVAVGDRFDDDLRYLTRFVGPDRSYGLVVGPGSATTAPRAILLVPARFGARAERAFVDAARPTRAKEGTTGADGGTAGADDEAARGDGTAAADFHDGVVRSVRMDRVSDPIGVRAAAVVDGWRDDGADGDAAGDGPEGDGGGTGGGRLFVPRSIPHDAAVYLQRAGYDLASTPVVAEARAIKTPEEIDRLRRVQRAAAAGMARAETVLARSEPREGPRSDADEAAILGSDGDEITTGRLERTVNATLAEYGVRAAGNTAVMAGTSGEEPVRGGASTGSEGAAGTYDVDGDGDVIRAGGTVRVDLAPRGPDGYYGALARTFVVDGDGGWTRRADIAVEAARSAGVAAIEPGEPAASVQREVMAELAAYGFDPAGTDDGVDAGTTSRVGHGVGLSHHEPPSLTGDAELRPGHVLAIGAGVSDPEHGGVRLTDLVVVTEGGHEILGEYPLGTVPGERM